MAAGVYILCALTSLVCALLLFRTWRAARAALPLWSGVCFAGLALNNLFLLLDLVVLQDVDLRAVRNGTALVAIVVLLYGLTSSEAR
jgi:hypothetical protein